MKYPNITNKTIAFIAPSDGLKKIEKQDEFELAKNNLKAFGYKTKESSSLFTSVKGRSNTKENRAKDVNTFLSDREVDIIWSVTGGDFLSEILDLIDFNLILNNPKWICGYSDVTSLLFYITTYFDIATLYTYNAGGFGYKILDESNYQTLELINNKELVFNEREYFEVKDYNNQSTEKFNLSQKTCWKSNVQMIKVQGRIIGGCLESLLDIVGTKFDHVAEFTQKYKDDGIIWYFDVYALSNEDITRALWHFINAGWFKYTNAILFGRLIKETSFYNISLEEAIKDGLKDLTIPFIYDMDFGHTNPKMPIVNGSIVEIEYNNKKRKMHTIFR